MIRKITISILISITATCSLHARVAVLPYKKYTADSKILKLSYSSLLATAIALGKKTEVVTPQEVTSSMELLGINGESNLTLENLSILSKKLDLDYIVTGSLSKVGKTFLSKSLVFSAITGDIVSREKIFGQNIISLAGKEAKLMLPMIPNRRSIMPAMKFDSVFMVDMSYHNRVNWPDIKKSIVKYGQKTMETGSEREHFYILPFSQDRALGSMGYGAKSPARLESMLNGMSPKGRSSEKSFATMLEYAVNTIKWRKGAVKRIFIITNSFPEKNFLAARMAKQVKKRGVHIFLIAGNRGVKGRGTAGRLVQLTRGEERSIVYRQILYNVEGEQHFLYMVGNRLFRSLFDYGGWEKLGEKISTSKSHRVFGKKGNLPEEIFSTVKFKNPENIGEYFEKTGHGKILRKGRLKTNIGYLMQSISGKGLKNSGAAIARALVFDGKLNLWVNIYDEKTLAALKQYGNEGFYRTTAFRIVKNSGNLYGLEFMPLGVSFPFNMVPGEVRVKFGDIIKNRNYFTRVGLGEIPTWFVDVKVQDIKVSGRGRDIRED